MSINEMTKNELKEYMNSVNGWKNVNKNEKAWDRAFQLYEQSTGARVDRGCGSCLTKVSEWLQR